MGDKPSNLEASSAANECDDENHPELSPTDAQRLLVKRALNSSKQFCSESHHSLTEEASLHTAPSLFSLLSIPSHFEGVNSNVDKNEVRKCKK